MNAEVLSVGTELLMGQIANTDAQYLSRELSALGINVYYHYTVGDNPGRLREAVKLALSRSDLIITTGGIGPTLDDLTKETIAEVLGMEMVEDPASMQKLRESYERSGRTMTPNNFRQGMFPKGSTALPNRRGTAPGCAIETGKNTIIILPGPPSELMDMFTQQVLPYLSAKSNEVIHSKYLRIFGVGESAAEHRLKDLFENQTNPTIASYAGTGEVVLRLTTKCAAGVDPEPIFAPMETEIRARLGDAVYAAGEYGLAYVVLEKLKAAGKTIAVAESCSGGMLSSMFVEFPGSSAAFIEGMVTYSNASKINRLGVQPQTIERYGAVSEQTAAEMAQGVLATTGADYALAITGIAGPDGGTEEKPVGLVYIAFASKLNPAEAIVRQLRLGSTRERIRTMSCLNALNLARQNM